jgi:O-antigen/teichoic acid export membrane protein
MGIVQIVATFGISAYVIRDQDLQDHTVDLAFTINALLSILLAAILLLLSPFSAFLLGDARAGEVLRLLALTPLLNILSFRAATMLQREMRFKAYGVIMTAQVVVNSSVTILLAWAGWSYLSSSIAGVTATACATLLLNLAAPHHFALRLRIDGWRRIARFGVEVMSVGGVTVLAARLCEIILGRIFGIAALGVYSRASIIYNLMYDNLYGAATRVIFSSLSQHYRETGRLREPFLRSFETILAVMWPLQLGLAVVAPPTILFLYGPQWTGAAAPLAVLMIAQMIVLSFGMNWELFVIRGQTHVQSRLEIRRAIVGVAAFSAGASFGLAGAAGGRVVDGLFGNYLYRGHVDRLAELRRGEIRRIMLRSFALAAAAAAPAALLMLWCGWSPHTPFLAVLGTVVAGILLWIAALGLLHHPLFRAARGLISGGPNLLAQSPDAR